MIFLKHQNCFNFIESFSRLSGQTDDHRDLSNWTALVGDSFRLNAVASQTARSLCFDFVIFFLSRRNAAF